MVDIHARDGGGTRSEQHDVYEGGEGVCEGAVNGDGDVCL